MEHPKFRAAYDLLALRAEVENNGELQRLVKWWGEFQVSAPPEQKDMLDDWAMNPPFAVAIAARANARRAVKAAHNVIPFRPATRRPDAIENENAGACMSPTLCYIAIGSNLASPLEQVKAALDAIGEIPQSRVVTVSSFYRTPPLGPQDQPDYLNAAVALETTLEAEALLDHTQRIELQQGRVRKAERWGHARWTRISCCLAIRLFRRRVSPFPITT